MANEILNIEFDGITDVPRLPGQGVVVWSGSGTTRISQYDVYFTPPNPGDTLLATANFSGSNWQIRAFRVAGDDHLTTIRDLDNGADRRIDFMELGFNSDVELISTRVRYIFGWDGDKHEVTLGNQQSGSTFSIDLFALENILTTGNAFVNTIRTGGSGPNVVGDTVTVGSGGVSYVQTGIGKDKVVINGFAEVVSTRDGNDTVIANGGVDYIKTQNGNDKVTTKTDYVQVVNAGDGNDLVEIGSGGGAMVRLGAGNDRIIVNETPANYGLTVHGGDGTDIIDFKKFTVGVTFSLDLSAAFQNVGAPRADPNVAAKGYFAESLLENIWGSNKSDTLTGDENRNVLLGKGGGDTLNGLAGNDTLNGAAGNDTLLGGSGKDTLLGGKGNDILRGDQGNDVLRGQAGKDVFVFGANSGTDTVKDYVDNSDKLRIADHNGGFQTLGISAFQGDKIIVHDGGTIILDGRGGVTLTASDFDFV